MKNEIKKMIVAGGKDWKAGGKHRVYFNRAAENWAGIEIDRYNSNWYSAKNFSVWYDVQAEEFCFRAEGQAISTAKLAIEKIKQEISK